MTRNPQGAGGHASNQNIEVMQRTIAFAINNTRETLSAFQWATANLVRPTDHILLIHVNDKLTASKNHGKKVLQVFADKCNRRNLKCSTINVQNTMTAHAIAGVCRSNPVDLCVMGSRGFGPVRRALMGSVSSATAVQSDCPVVAIKTPKDTAGAFLTVMPRRTFIYIDESIHTKRAFAWAERHLLTRGLDEVVMVRIETPNKFPTLQDQELDKVRGEIMFDDFEKRLRILGIATIIKIREVGPPAETLLRITSENSCDLLVAGLGCGKSVFGKCVAMYAAHNAPYPVVVVGHDRRRRELVSHMQANAAPCFTPIRNVLPSPLYSPISNPSEESMIPLQDVSPDDSLSARWRHPQGPEGSATSASKKQIEHPQRTHTEAEHKSPASPQPSASPTRVDTPQQQWLHPPEESVTTRKRRDSGGGHAGEEGNVRQRGGMLVGDDSVPDPEHLGAFSHSVEAALAELDRMGEMEPDQMVGRTRRCSATQNAFNNEEILNSFNNEEILNPGRRKVGFCEGEKTGGERSMGNEGGSRAPKTSPVRACGAEEIVSEIHTEQGGCNEEVACNEVGTEEEELKTLWEEGVHKIDGVEVGGDVESSMWEKDGHVIKMANCLQRCRSLERDIEWLLTKSPEERNAYLCASRIPMRITPSNNDLENLGAEHRPSISIDIDTRAPSKAAQIFKSSNSNGKNNSWDRSTRRRVSGDGKGSSSLSLERHFEQDLRLEIERRSHGRTLHGTLVKSTSMPLLSSIDLSA